MRPQKKSAVPSDACFHSAGKSGRPVNLEPACCKTDAEKSHFASLYSSYCRMNDECCDGLKESFAGVVAHTLRYIGSNFWHSLVCNLC